MVVSREAAEFGKWGGESWGGAGVASWGWPYRVWAPMSQRRPPTQRPQLPNRSREAEGFHFRKAPSLRFSVQPHLLTFLVSPPNKPEELCSHLRRESKEVNHSQFRPGPQTRENT